MQSDPDLCFWERETATFFNREVPIACVDDWDEDPSILSLLAADIRQAAEAARESGDEDIVVVIDAYPTASRLKWLGPEDHRAIEGDEQATRYLGWIEEGLSRGVGRVSILGESWLEFCFEEASGLANAYEDWSAIFAGWSLAPDRLRIVLKDDFGHYLFFEGDSTSDPGSYLQVSPPFPGME